MNTFGELEEILAARIVALDSTAYDQGMSATEVWAESDIPMTASQDSLLQQHLAFSVTVEGAPVVDDGSASEGVLTTLCAITVVFVYRIRTDDQLRDVRLGAQRAALDVAGALMRPDVLWGSMLPLEIYKPHELTDGFLPIEQRYTALLDVQLPGFGGIG